MSDPLGSVRGTGVVNTTGSIQNNDNKPQGSFGPRRSPHPSDRNTNISFAGATVYKNAPVPDNYKTAIETIRQPKPSNTFLHKLGRAALWIVNLFKGVKSSSTLSTREKLDVLRNKKPSPLPNNVVNKGTPYSFNIEMLANLSGLDKSKGLKYQPFYNMDKEPEKNYKDVLFPHGEPRLADVKQNPELQDCWFLSSIASTLQSEGTQSITRLFSPSNTPGNVVVRLGTNLYDVPMGRIADGSGDKFGSDSAPWVVVLENAMLMHLSLSTENPNIKDPVALENYKDDIRMPLRSANHGLIALHGGETQGKKTVINVSGPLDSAERGMDIIAKLLSFGKPVVIGQTSGTPLSVAIKDGVANGHAVTVLEVVPNGVKILDPYGQVKTISASSLNHYAFNSVRDVSEPAEKYNFIDYDDGGHKAVDQGDWVEIE